MEKLNCELEKEKMITNCMYRQIQIDVQKRKWNELKIRDKKFTYIVVVDFGLVKSTRKTRKLIRMKWLITGKS